MEARLTLEDGDARPEVLDLDPEAPVTLGRSRDNSVVLRDEHASRLHVKIAFEGGRWVLRDFGLNGTRVNGERVQQQVELEHGQEIRVGDTKLRFTMADSRLTGRSTPIPKNTDKPTLGPSSTTRLMADEMSGLCALMAETVGESDPRPMIRAALQLVMDRTGASVVGLLSADPSEPLPKMVLPAAAAIDVALSRQLTRRVRRDGKTIWLGTDLAETQPSDSLAPFTDALCVPLEADGSPLGALHVYKASAFFAERSVRLCEAVAAYLAGRLFALRGRRALEAEVARLRGPVAVDADADADELVGDGPALRQLRSLIDRLAPQPFP